MNCLQKDLLVFFSENQIYCHLIKQNQKYRGMFETQKSGNKTSSGEIGLNIRM